MTQMSGVKVCVRLAPRGSFAMLTASRSRALPRDRQDLVELEER